MVLIETLASQRKVLVSSSVKQWQNVAWVYFTMVIIVICLLTEKKSLSLKAIIEMSTFLLSFVLEVYKMGLVLLIQEKKYL